MQLANIFPITRWSGRYTRALLRADVIAGITVTALVVPKNLGYAEIAGAPIENGLYAAAAGAILYALFGSSRQISTGPSSGLSAVAGSAVLAAGLFGSADAAAMVAGIALCAGLIFVLMWLLRLGWIAQFISKAVVTGFLFGAAIDVVAGELPKLTGTDASGDNAWQEIWSWLSGLSETRSLTLVVGAGSLALLFGMRALAPNVPGELVVVALGLAASAIFELDERGVALVGEVPRGLPSMAVPSLQLIGDHAVLVFGAALAIVMIGFSQTTGDARHFAAKNGYRVDIDQESLAQGAANIGAGLFHGIPVSTSLSATSLNDRAGAKSQIASLVTGGVIILTLLFLAPVFSNLPKAVLGAVIIEAVTLGMMDVPELQRLCAVKRSDFWIALAAITGVVLFGVLAGVVIGVFLSIAWLVKVVSSPAIPRLGRVRGTHVFRDLDTFPDDEPVPGVLAIRLEGALFFVTADALEDRILALVEEQAETVKLFVLDCQSINFIDAQGAEKLGKIVEFLTSRGIEFRVARIKMPVFEVLERDGIVGQVGADHFHLDVDDAVDAYLASTQFENHNL